ncbi:hypothetical protein ADIS_4747 [Lunatimonas lonarensis]|uniref:Uncharacterized protein n=1 Tax=Lunatimonas lonarensis TaxID=1232681 RepID=R7ZKZ8_9BACT|nr:hypothetical protein [Lunatimonas lonarensis]EON74776.1 hypothetical protein ADIS_4747 [Lunatimonas lonarensis]
MNRILNLICPTSHLESFIAKKTAGRNIANYYVTSLGVALHLHKKDDAENLKTILSQYEIEEIHLFQDVFCPFIKNTLEKKRPSEFYIDRILEKILHEQIRQEEFWKADYRSKAGQLAEKNLLLQIQSIHQNPLLTDYITKQKLLLKGIIIDKSENKILRELSYSPKISA